MRLTRRARTTRSTSSSRSVRIESLRLEDTDGDGRFDKSVVFADRMMFPEGAMWLDGSLSRRGAAEHLEADRHRRRRVADRREEWFQGKTLTSCANDLHGPYLGPDGWIYWTKGHSPSRPTNVQGSRRSSPAPRTSSGADPAILPSTSS